MQKYFASIRNNNIILSEEDKHHLLHVMRSKKGDNIFAIENKKMYLSEIKSINPLKIEIVKEVINDRELKKDLTLFLCLPKGDKIDFIIQKATELGVKKLILVKSKRSVNKMNNDDFERKLMRYNKIIKEASEQCGRSELMQIFGITALEKLDSSLLSDINLIANENKSGETGQIDKNLSSSSFNSVSIFIGPEGGFDSKEIEYLHNLGFKDVSLGKRILRLETAAVYALSVIGYFLEKEND